jgi:hypothetical protein
MIGSRIMKRALVAFGLVIPVLVMAGCHYPERLSTKGEQRGTHIVMKTTGALQDKYGTSGKPTR